MEAKKIKLVELAGLVKGKIVGNQEVVIQGVADLDSAEAGEITFLVDPKKSQQLQSTNASAIVVPEAIQEADKPIIKVKDPYLAIALIHNHFMRNFLKHLASVLKHS